MLVNHNLRYSNSVSRTTFVASAMLVTLLLISSPLATATVLLERNIDEVVNLAELVFEGSVINIETAEDAAGSISSYITFKIEDLIKGDYSGSTLELKFLGGTLGGRTVAVSGSRLPQQDETGIYFVESTSADLINPLLGWSQGQFLIQRDDAGVARVVTANNEPISAIQSISNVPAAIRRPAATFGGDVESASGVVIEDDILMLQRALSVDEFKAVIRGLITP